MRLSQKYPVPGEFALLYEFVNSLDLRSFVEKGRPHPGGDELASARQLETWMRCRGLLAPEAALDEEDLRQALALRRALRGMLSLAPEERGKAGEAAAAMNAAAAAFPLMVQMTETGSAGLQPLPGRPSGGLARVLAELHHAAETSSLDRLKMCASEECRWVFFDRSKPGTRRWCSSALCGNRQKTRTYRSRRQGGPPSPSP